MPWGQGGRFRRSQLCCKRAGCYPDTVLPFLCFWLLGADAEGRGNRLARTQEPVMGMAGLAAAAMASVGAVACGFLKVFSFPTWQILNSHAAKASDGILCPLGQSAGGSEVLLHFREGSMC